MTTGELRSVITQPATRVQCAVEGTLVTELVAEAAGQAGMLPWLSDTLLETWRRRRGNALTLTGYQASGGIGGALARAAEHQYELLDADQRTQAKYLFRRLTDRGEGRRRVPRVELDSEDSVLARLVAARLVTVDADTVEITHDALVTAWPRLRDWLAEDVEGLRIHRHLTGATAAWQELGRDPGALYRGTRLDIVRDWAVSTGAVLTQVEREFLRASLSNRAHEDAALRRRSRRLRQLIAILAVLLIVATTAVVYAANGLESAAH